MTLVRVCALRPPPPCEHTGSNQWELTAASFDSTVAVFLATRLGGYEFDLELARMYEGTKALEGPSLGILAAGPTGAAVLSPTSRMFVDEVSEAASAPVSSKIFATSMSECVGAHECLPVLGVWTLPRSSWPHDSLRIFSVLVMSVACCWLVVPCAGGPTASCPHPTRAAWETRR